MKESAVKEVKIGNQILRIFADDSADSPRTWDNLGKMICFHKNYSLGDKHEYKAGDYDGWNEMEKAIAKKEDAAIILPLYLLDHSGITISTVDFNDRWDSGQVGFIVISKEKIRKEYSVKRISEKLIEDVTKYLIGEVETYDQYIRGDVYRFEIVKIETCDMECEHETHVDSCGGFFGSDFANNGITGHLVEAFAKALGAD